MSATLCSPFWFRFLCPLHAFCSAPMEQKKQRCQGGHTVLRRSSPDTPFHALFRVRFGVRSFVYICVRPPFFFLFTYKVRKRGGGFVLVCTVYGSVLVHCYIPEPSCLTDRCRVYFFFSHFFFFLAIFALGAPLSVARPPCLGSEWVYKVISRPCAPLLWCWCGFPPKGLFSYVFGSW